jgi:hypothetical protein
MTSISAKPSSRRAVCRKNVRKVTRMFPGRLDTLSTDRPVCLSLGAIGRIRAFARGAIGLGYRETGLGRQRDGAIALLAQSERFEQHVPVGLAP